MSERSWGSVSNPFKFSRHLYAPTVTSDGLSSAPTNISRNTRKSYYRRYPQSQHYPQSNYSQSNYPQSNRPQSNRPQSNYPQSNHSHKPSLKSLTYTSSLKSSSAPYKHRYYESVESLPSTASIGPIVPSTNLNPPKITKTWYKTPIIWIKILSICILITLFILSLKFQHKVSLIFNPYLNIIKSDHSWGVGLFSIMLFVSIISMVPQTLFIINCCIIIVNIWGKTQGIIITISIVWSINFIAAIICYFYGKFLMRNLIQSFLHKFKVIELTEKNMFDINGWKFVLIFRILPMNTYNLMNYILGFTSLDLCGVIIGNIGMIPNIFLYCLIATYFTKTKIDKILFILMIIEIIISIIPILWWSLWIYWNASNQCDKTRENMLNSPDQSISASPPIHVDDLDDTVSNL